MPARDAPGRPPRRLLLVRRRHERGRVRVGEARRIVSTLACNLGFDATAAGHLAIITTEAANNLALHATGGRLVLQPYSVGDSAWIELLALDTGTGMADLAKCLGDGYSTIGTAGQGLGAISRLADLFDVYSVPGKGTALLARVACSSSNSSDRCAAVGTDRRHRDVRDELAPRLPECRAARERRASTGGG